MQSISPSQLNAARNLAQHGQTKEAVAAYRALFKGNPPDDLALEYYQTMAGDSATWSEGVAGLRQRVKMMPDDNASKQALAMALTWQQDTRREGIAQPRPSRQMTKAPTKRCNRRCCGWNPKHRICPFIPVMLSVTRKITRRWITTARAWKGMRPNPVLMR
jgi:hypothetical protein